MWASLKKLLPGRKESPSVQAAEANPFEAQDVVVTCHKPNAVQALHAVDNSAVNVEQILAQLLFEAYHHPSVLTIGRDLIITFPGRVIPEFGYRVCRVFQKFVRVNAHSVTLQSAETTTTLAPPYHSPSHCSFVAGAQATASMSDSSCSSVSPSSPRTRSSSTSTSSSASSSSSALSVSQTSSPATSAFPSSVSSSRKHSNVFGQTRAAVARRFSDDQGPSTPTNTALRLFDFSEGDIIGAGTFGRVFRMKHLDSGTHVAMKVMSKDPELKKQVQSERQALVELIGQPYILPLLAAFHDENNYYLVTPLYELGNLTMHIERYDGHLPQELAVFWAAEILLGLQGSHGRGVVHRDVKPDNIFVGEDGHIVLADFGLATRVVPEGAVYDPAAPVIPLWGGLGTMEYISPEEWLLLHYHFPKDVYAFAVTLFYMFVGRPIWIRYDDDTPVEMGKRTILGTMDTFLGDECLPSPEAYSIIEWMLTSDQDARPTLEQLKSHPFFDSIDWKTLERGEVSPPESAFPPPFSDEDEYYDDLNAVAQSSENDLSPSMFEINGGMFYEPDTDPCPEFNFTCELLLAKPERTCHPPPLASVAAHGSSRSLLYGNFIRSDTPIAIHADSVVCTAASRARAYDFSDKNANIFGSPQPVEIDPFATPELDSDFPGAQYIAETEFTCDILPTPEPAPPSEVKKLIDNALPPGSASSLSKSRSDRIYEISLESNPPVSQAEAASLPVDGCARQDLSPSNSQSSSGHDVVLPVSPSSKICRESVVAPPELERDNAISEVSFESRSSESKPTTGSTAASKILRLASDAHSSPRCPSSSVPPPTSTPRTATDVEKSSGTLPILQRWLHKAASAVQALRRFWRRPWRSQQSV